MAGAKSEMVASYSNLSALGCLIALVLWFATTGLPEIMSKWESQSEAMRSDFRTVVDGMLAESKEQRQDFRDEMKLHREQANRLAVSGHEAVHVLSQQLNELKEAVEARKHGAAD